MSAKYFLRLAAVLGLTASAAFGAANIVIVNVDGPGEGFNDPTIVSPVGGNSGTTVGQQRLIAFQHAAAIWGQRLDSAVEIRVRAAFNPLSCSPTSGVVGSAGAIVIVRDSPGTEYPATWYHVALANKLAGVDLVPGPAGTSADDIGATFNSNLGRPAA